MPTRHCAGQARSRDAFAHRCWTIASARDQCVSRTAIRGRGWWGSMGSYLIDGPAPHAPGALGPLHKMSVERYSDGREVEVEEWPG